MDVPLFYPECSQGQEFALWPHVSFTRDLEGENIVVKCTLVPDLSLSDIERLIPEVLAALVDSAKLGYFTFPEQELSLEDLGTRRFENLPEPLEGGIWINVALRSSGVIVVRGDDTVELSFEDAYTLCCECLSLNEFVSSGLTIEENMLWCEDVT